MVVHSPLVGFYAPLEIRAFVDFKFEVCSQLELAAFGHSYIVGFSSFID